MQLYLKKTPSLVSFKDFGKFSSNFIWHVRDWKMITYFIEHPLMASLLCFKRILAVDRSSRLEVFRKKGVLQNSQGGTCMGVSFSIKLQPVSLQLYEKKRIRYMYFPMNFAKFLRTPFYRTFAKGCFCADWKHFCFVEKLLTFL